jgi:hypothetical protein
VTAIKALPAGKSGLDEKNAIGCHRHSGAGIQFIFVAEISFSEINDDFYRPHRCVACSRRPKERGGGLIDVDAVGKLIT